MSKTCAPCGMAAGCSLPARLCQAFLRRPRYFFLWLLRAGGNQPVGFALTAIRHQEAPLILHSEAPCQGISQPDPAVSLPYKIMIDAPAASRTRRGKSETPAHRSARLFPETIPGIPCCTLQALGLFLWALIPPPGQRQKSRIGRRRDFAASGRKGTHR